MALYCKNCKKTMRLECGPNICYFRRKAIEPQEIKKELGEDWDALDFIDNKLNEIIDWINKHE